MSFLADLVTHDSHMAFEKCGDVVVSPKDNKLALFCHFCKDLITCLPQFLRHLHEAHGDVLQFTTDHNVYSVEELLSGEEAGEDQQAKEVENNSQDEDAGMPQVKETPEECEESKNTPNIQIDLPDQMEEETSASTRDVLAEVEAMLLSEEEVAEECPQEDLAMKAYLEMCQGLQEKKAQTKAAVINKTEPESQRSKGGRNRKEVGLKISRLRSHAIARQSRKRMSSVKKRILRSIDNFAPKKQIADNQEKANEQVQPLPTIRPRVPLSRTPCRPPMNAPHLSVRKSTLTTARISLQMTTTTTTSSETVVSCSNEEEASQTTKKEDAYKENEVKIESSQKSMPIEIQNIEIIPKVNTQNANSDDIDLDKELAALLGSPMRSNSKEKKESPLKAKNSITKIQKLNKDIKSYITNRTQLKTTTTNVENKLDILLGEIDSMKTTTSTLAENIEVLIDNCTLLKYVGLPVVHCPDYEDKIMLDELEDLHAKAAKFCEVYRKYEEIWNCRRIKPTANDPKQLAGLIELLTQDLNAALGCQLSKIEVKRILNLITLWFWHTVDLKHFRKLSLPSSTQHYFNLFAFIPQLTRFVFFCEYCDENFNLEAAYRKHLMSHSFTIRCAICRKAFKGHGHLDRHLRAYHAHANVLKYI